MQPRAVRLRLRGNDLLVAPVSTRISERTDVQLPADEGATESQRVERAAGDRTLRGRLLEVVPGRELVYDQRLLAFRTLPRSYRAVAERLERDSYSIEVEFDPAPALPFTVQPRQQPRSYQSEALLHWSEAGHRGVVVLPTGAGKTLVALLAIAKLGVTTLIVVPTLDLLEQWRRAVVEVLGVPREHVATYGGGSQALGPITVMTYDSAAIHTRELHRFGFIVFDEVHHLPAASYRRAAEGAAAPYRLGLSATPERADGKEADLISLVGQTVYSRSPAALSGHLASYSEIRIRVDLTADETARYGVARATYRDFIRRRHLRITSPEDFQRWVIWPSANDPEARVAMLAHREARRLSFNAEGKMASLIELLGRHATDRVIVFSEFNAVVEDISRRLLMPSITHRTPGVERGAILDGFRTGRFTKLVTGRVLNEGVDVPDANIAIVLSGSATRREYVQRLGRVLRPKDTPAVLYELVSEETGEQHVTRRRHIEPTDAV